MLCCQLFRTGPWSKYTDRGSICADWRSQPSPTLRRSRNVQGPRNDTATISSYDGRSRSEEHTSELQSRQYLVCRLLLAKKKVTRRNSTRVAGRKRFSNPSGQLGGSINWPATRTHAAQGRNSIKAAQRSDNEQVVMAAQT